MGDRYPRLTPMRAFELLAITNEPRWNDQYKLERVRDALSCHVKAALTAKKKRKAAKVVKLRSVG